MPPHNYKIDGIETVPGQTFVMNPDGSFTELTPEQAAAYKAGLTSNVYTVSECKWNETNTPDT